MLLRQDWSLIKERDGFHRPPRGSTHMPSEFRSRTVTPMNVTNVLTLSSVLTHVFRTRERVKNAIVVQPLGLWGEPMGSQYDGSIVSQALWTENLRT